MPADVRVASADDCDELGRLLHAFNTEYDDITPGPEALAARMRVLLEAGDTVALLAGESPDGAAVLRFRPAIWVDADECYLAELYVTPEQRGHGLGKALLAAVIETARARGCAWIDLDTGEDDLAARHLYESFGFINREGPGGPISYAYELEL